MSDPSAPDPATGVPTCYRHAGRETWIRCQRCEQPICPDCMRDAAVGFQCPSCIKEGAKSTRSGRTAYGGRRPTNPAITSIGLIAINVAVWLAVLATGGAGSWLIDVLGLRPHGVFTCGNLMFRVPVPCQQVADTIPGVVDGAPWQLVTSQFLHVQLWHIAGNMLALWMLGPQLEAALGRARFLALYLLSGLAGSTAVLWFSPEFQLTLGASGAIYGLFGALAVITIKVRGDLRSIAVLLALNLVITFAVPNISWQGHLGGLLGGAAIAGILIYAPRSRRAQTQLLGLVGVSALLVMLIVLRAAALA